MSVLAFLSVAIFASSAHATLQTCVVVPEFSSLETGFGSANEKSMGLLRSGDPVGPFPLSALIPFSWSSIDGIWSMRLPDGTSLYLSLQAQADCNGRRFLRVVNFDQRAFFVNSEGIGIALSNDTIVRAVMTSQTSQHMIFLRQYKMPHGKSGSKVSTVVTIRPFNGTENEDVHMIARKASSLTLEQYIQRQRELEAERTRRSVR